MSAIRTAYSSFKLSLAVGRILLRFFLGRNGVLSGERKTDATFLRPATRSLDPSGTALRWEMLPGWKRLLVRLGVLYLLLLSIPLLILQLLSASGVSLSPYLRPSFILLAHAGVSALLFSVLLLRRHLRDHGYSVSLPLRTEEGAWEMCVVAEAEGAKEWTKEKVLPVAGAISQVLGVSWPLEKEKISAVSIPRNYHDGGRICISLPSGFAGIEEKRQRSLERVVAERLGAREFSSTLQLEGSSPRILLSVPPLPPKEVSFSSVEKHLLSSQEYRPFLGITRGDEGLVAEMIDDSPHIALSAGPGAGKSMLAKLIIMQALRWGWGVVVIDWKKTKQFTWLEGLQGVTYLSDIQAIHDFGIRISEEIDLRKSDGMSGRANVLVVRDEWNVTAELLFQYWDRYYSMLSTEEKKTEPRKSPSLAGYAMLDFAGREFGMFDLCVAQRFSARIFNGNADQRECFNIKLMARYSEQTKRMLVGNMKPFPKKSNTPGRWTVVAGEDVTVVQAPLITNEEAREYASGGVENPLTPFSSSYTLSPGQQGSADSTLPHHAAPGVAGGSQPQLPILEGEAVEIHPKKLSEMVDELRDTVDDRITLKILQKAAGDPQSGFPAVIGGSPTRGYTYDVQAVKMWTRNRNAARVAERMGK